MKYLSGPSDEVLLSSITLVQSRTAFSREYWFPQLILSQYVIFVMIPFSCELPLYANYHLKSKCKLRQPIFIIIPTIEIICRFLGCGLSHVLSWKSCTVLVSAVVLPRGYVALIEDDHIKIKSYPYPYLWCNMFHATSRIRVGLVKRIRCCAFICTVQWRLVATRYRPEHPHRYHRLTLDHLHHHLISACRHKNCNHQYWSPVIFADEASVSFWSSQS